MSYLPSMPNAGLLDVFKAYPEFAGPLHVFAQTLMRGPSLFSEAERELMAAYVSGINGCDFCLRSHAAVAERLGVDADRVDELLNEVHGMVVSKKLRPVLNYLRKLTEAPGWVSQTDIDAVYAARAGPKPRSVMRPWCAPFSTS